MPHREHYKDLQLPQLRTFCMAAARGNFTTAAEALGLSVSAVWQQVRALEGHLGASLLRRRGRAVELTSEGRLLLDLIQPYLSGLDSLKQLFEARRQDLPRQLSVVATDYLLSYNLPKAVEKFTALSPAVRLNLRADSPRAVLRLVENGEADIGITTYDRDEPRSPVLNYQDLFERQLQLLCSNRHPLARQKHIVPADLTKYPMIVPPRGSFSQRMLERLLQRHGLAEQIHVMMESRAIGVVCHYAALGLGIALLYVDAEICSFLPNLRLRVFDPQAETLPVAVITRKGTHPTEHAALFCETVCRLLTKTQAGAAGDKPARANRSKTKN
jgi:DNA-binding transcriptional LysR family regulator